MEELYKGKRIRSLSLPESSGNVAVMVSIVWREVGGRGGNEVGECRQTAWGQVSQSPVKRSGTLSQEELTRAAAWCTE